MASFEGKLLRCGVTRITINSLGRSYFKVIVKKDYGQAKAGTVNEILTNARNIYELKIRNYEEKEFPLEIENKTIYETLQEAIAMGMNSRISYECMVLLKMSAMTHILSANYEVVKFINQFNAAAPAAAAKVGHPTPPSSPAASARGDDMPLDGDKTPPSSSTAASGGNDMPVDGATTPPSTFKVANGQLDSHLAAGGASRKLPEDTPPKDVIIEPGFIVAMQKIIMFSENMPIIITEQDKNLKEVNALVDLVFSYLDRIKNLKSFYPQSYIDDINTQIKKVKKAYSLESHVLLGCLKICEFKIA